MSSGALINIFISIGLTPIVMRMYTKEDFGVFYIYMSIIGIAVVLVNGMYPQAFVVPKFKSDFLALLKLSFLLTFFGSFIFFILLAFFGDWFLNLIEGQEIGVYKYLLPGSLFLTSCYTILVNWNVRRKDFKKNATSNIATSLSIKGFQISYGSTINHLFPGLIFSDLISKVVGSFVLGIKQIPITFMLLKKVSYSDMKQIAREYYKYPTYIAGSNLINATTTSIPLYILSSFFGIDAVGAFGFANSMLNIPYNVIGNSIAPVYYQKAAELYYKDANSLKDFTLKSYNKMLLLGSLAFGVVFAFGDHLFRIVFSAEWELAGNIAMVLSVYYIFKLISSPFSRIFRVVRKEEIALRVNVYIAILRILGIGIGVFTGSLIYAIIVFSLANILGYAYLNFKVFDLLKIKISTIFIKTLKITIPIFSIMYVFRVLIEMFFLN